MTFVGSPLIIFDCDGVLVDTETISAQTLSLYLRKLGVDQSPQRLAELYCARAFNYIETDLRAKYGSLIEPDFEQDYRAFLYKEYEQKLKAIKGVSEAIEALKTPIKCVASNAPREKIELVLKITALEKYFSPQAIFSAYEVGSWKPDPGLFLAAAQSFAFSPSRCIVIEDSVIGAQAARQAGMHCLHYRPKETVAGVTGFQSMSELPQLIEALSLTLA